MMWTPPPYIRRRKCQFNGASKWVGRHLNGSQYSHPEQTRLEAQMSAVGHFSVQNRSTHGSGRVAADGAGVECAGACAGFIIDVDTATLHAEDIRCQFSGMDHVQKASTHIAS